MYGPDLARLREIAARPEEDAQSDAMAPLSNARLRVAAQAVIAHSERFDFDSEPTPGSVPGAEGFDFHVYAGSLLADLFALADIMEPREVDQSGPRPIVRNAGGARNIVERALFFLSESDVDCSAADLYEKVRVSL